MKIKIDTDLLLEVYPDAVKLKDLPRKKKKALKKKISKFLISLVVEAELALFKETYVKEVAKEFEKLKQENETN